MLRVFGQEQIIAAVDVGTTKICALIARVIDNHFDIIGIGKAISQGLAKGVVVDVGKTIESIKYALKEAELMAGIPIEQACIGISGSHIHSINSHGVVPIRRGEITELDVSAVLAAAKAIVIPEGQQILHVLPQYFIIDGQSQVSNPVGMFGVRLEVQAHIIIGSVATAQNLIKCCQLAGITVSDIVLEQLASAQAVLSPDERLLGVGVLDIGGGTSDFAIYQQNSIRHTKVIPVAGNHFTNDIAIGLRTTITQAESIKKQYALALLSLLQKDDFIEIESVSGDQNQVIQISDIVRIINPRSSELLTLVKKEIDLLKLSHFMPTGLVLTGGGSLLNGLQELAQEIFTVPVRVGTISNCVQIPSSLNSPVYATAVGLLLHSMQKQQQGIKTIEGPLVKKVYERMKSWMLDFF